MTHGRIYGMWGRGTMYPILHCQERISNGDDTLLKIIEIVT
jgi:hypothetical protein